MKQLLKIAVVILCMALCNGLAQAGTTCPLVIAGDFSVSYVQGFTPVIVVKIGGRPLHMMVDSGSGMSVVSTKTWSALGDPEFASLDGYVTGVGGNVQLNTVIIQDIDTGHAMAKEQDLIVNDQTLALPKGRLPVDGVLGEDFLDNFDIGYDLPDNRITLYFRQDCDTAEAPWAGDFDVEPLVVNKRQMVDFIPYVIDGHTLNGRFDTGAQMTMLTSAAMARSGIKPAAQPPGLTENAVGIGARSVVTHREMFDNITIGAESFDHAWLWVAKTPISDFVDVLVGQDYLQTHRVFISNSSGTALLGLYVTKPPL